MEQNKRPPTRTIVVEKKIEEKREKKTPEQLLELALDLIQGELERIKAKSLYQAIDDNDFRRLTQLTKSLKDLSSEKRSYKETEEDELSSLSDEELKKLASESLGVNKTTK